MALPGRSKWLPVATVTYINYPSRRKPSFRRAPGCGLRFCPPRGFSERPYERCMMLTEFAIDRPCPHELVSSTIMPDGFLAIAAICRPRGATCWVLQVGLSFKLICHSAVEPRVTGRTKLARWKRGSYSYHINQTTVTLTRHRWPPHPPGTSSASHCADCQTALRTRSGSPGRHRA